MKNLFLLILTSAAILAHGQTGFEYKLELHLDATYDQEETDRIRKQDNPVIEFMGLNTFIVESKSFDTLGLERGLADILIRRRQTTELTILDSKDRIYAEHVLIVGQLHRIILRMKDTISIERHGLKYKEIMNQQDINSIDTVVPLEIMVVDKTHWR